MRASNVQSRRKLNAEKAELDQKLAMLDGFLFSERSEGLSEYPRSVLMRQRVAMSDYSEALGERLACLTD